MTGPTGAAASESDGLTPADYGAPYTTVSIPTQSRVNLPGWWLDHASETFGTIIVCTGYRGQRNDMVGIGSALWRHGFNVLLFDYRGHGELIGMPVTLGYHELQDTLEAITWVQERVPGAPVGLLGYSMGGAVAIMAGARSPKIAAVVADSPFASQYDVIKTRLQAALHVPPYPLMVIVNALLHLRYGFGFRDVDPLSDVARISPRPLLLIHGDSDTVTDPHDSRALFAEAGHPKDLWLIPEIEHCGAYFADTPTYIERVCHFFDKTFGRQEQANEPGRPSQRV